MASTVSSLGLALLLLPLLAVVTSAEQTPVQALTSANNEFGENLMQELAPFYDNVVISPYSLHVVLSMTALGAAGKTLEEMEDALETDDIEDVHKAYGELVNTFDSTGPVKLLTANGLFQNPDYSIGQEFKDNAEMWFDASVEELDFDHAKGPEAPINEWVAENTNDMITDLLAPGTIDRGSTILVLVNTLFFNASWANQFDKLLTKSQDFMVDSKETASVEMMTRTNEYEVKFEDTHHVLRLPFEGDRFALYFVVPTDSSVLTEVPEFVPHEYPNYLFDISGLEKTQCKIHVPKFEIKFKESFVKTLQFMGMKRAFATGADFSGINDAAFISEVVQQNVIQVTESGTTAAAASFVTMTRSLLPEEIPHFWAKKPFMFFLRDDVHGENLFEGKFTRPSERPAQLVTRAYEVPRSESAEDDGNGSAQLSSALIGWISFFVITVNALRGAVCF